MPRLQRHWLMLEMIIKLDIPYIRQRPMYKDAVITVPAYFTHAQKWVTVTAAECACLNVLRTISEPTAAAMAYFFANEVNLGDNLMIIGLGGFTSEVSILTIDEDTCEFHAARIHFDLGGHKFDRNMVNHFAEWFEINQGINIGTNERSLYRLGVACERAKRSLSVETVANVQVDSLVENIDFNRQITRALFQSLNSQEFRSIIDTIRQALQDAVMEKTQIDAIIMVGGSSRIPRIQSLIRDYFNGMQLHMNIDPDHVVAIGAARLAAYDRLEEFSENFDRINQHIADLS